MKITLSARFNKIIFSKFSCQAPLSTDTGLKRLHSLTFWHLRYKFIGNIKVTVHIVSFDHYRRFRTCVCSDELGKLNHQSLQKLIYSTCRLMVNLLLLTYCLQMRLADQTLPPAAQQIACFVQRWKCVSIIKFYEPIDTCNLVSVES